MSEKTPVIGIIGGSGLYDLPGLENPTWQAVETPFGAPSDELLSGELLGQKLVFLPRHGRGHVLSPTDLNVRANLWALKSLGVTDVLSFGAVGSLKEHLPPGTFVVVDQYIDRTYARVPSYFGPGMVAHVSLAEPSCGRLAAHMKSTLEETGTAHQMGGTYLCIEGPQFSTRAESDLYRSWNCDVIGMTAMPEARIAREAELCYLSIAMITDFDCWHPDHDAVTVEQLIQQLMSNASEAQTVLANVIPRLKDRPDTCPKGCDTALDSALITAPDKRDPAVLGKLDLIMRRVLA